jgi:hypothetical protein
MIFLWSDAWLLQAVALASSQGPAALADVVAAADAVNHAFPTDDEFHGGFCRLTEAGFVREIGDRFGLGPEVPSESAIAMAGPNATEGRRIASDLLRAEAWASKTNTRDPRNGVQYPGLTDDRLRKAEREYRQKGPT